MTIAQFVQLAIEEDIKKEIILLWPYSKTAKGGAQLLVKEKELLQELK